VTPPHTEIVRRPEDDSFLLDESIVPEKQVELEIQSILRSEWERRKKTLPPIKNFRYAEGSLDRMLWPTWKFTTSDPYLQTQKFPTEIEYSLGSVDVFIFCPHTFWPHLLKNFILRCPACEKSDGLALDGWNTTFREIVDLGRNRFILSRRYRHRNCPIAIAQGKASSIFTSLNPKFISTLPEVVTSQLEMEIFPRTIVSSDLEVFAREMQQIASFRSAASLQKTLKSTQQSRAEKKYLLAMQSLRSQGKNYA
jgi:hypothetical protein